MSLYRFEHAVVTAGEQDTIGAVARRMRDARVGCVIVTEADRPIGILTDRDIVVRVVAEGVDPERARVESIMTRDATMLLRTAGISAATRTMRDLGVRRLPIVDDDGRITGIVTADNLTELFASGLSDVTRGISENVEASETR